MGSLEQKLFAVIGVREIEKMTFLIGRVMPSDFTVKGDVCEPGKPLRLDMDITQGTIADTLYEAGGYAFLLPVSQQEVGNYAPGYLYFIQIRKSSENAA